MNRPFALLFGLALLAASGLYGADAKTLSGQWVTYGNGLSAQKKPAEAESAYLKATQLDAANAAAWQGLGNARVFLKRKDDALAAYQKCLELNPNNAALAAYVAKLKSAPAPAAAPAKPASEFEDAMDDAEALRLQGRAAEAAKAYQLVLAGNPPSDVAAKAYLGLGDASYAMGLIGEARADYKKGLALDPDNAKARAFLDEHLNAEAREDAGGRGDWVNALWRSALVPGWGQAHNGETTKAFIVGGLTWGCLAGTAVTYFTAKQAEDHYNGLDSSASHDEFDSSYGRVQTWGNANHVFYIAFSAFYAYNLADAMLNARPATVRPVLGMTGKGTPTAGAQISF